MIAIHYYATKGKIRVYHEPELDGGTGFGQIPIPRRLGVDNSCCIFSEQTFIDFFYLALVFVMN